MTEGASPLNASIITSAVIPEWFYEGSKLFKGKNMGSHLLVTPAIFKPGSTVFKTKEKSMDSRLKISGTTREEASLLNVFVRNLNNGRRRPYGSKKKKHGFPTKNFGNDRKVL